MSSTRTSELLGDASRRACEYLDGLEERRVSPSPAALAGLDALGGDLPEGGTDPREVLRLLDEAGSPATIASAGGRYFGYVTGGALPVTLACNWLAGAWDQNAFSKINSPVGAAVDAIALRWLLEVLDLPRDSGGALVTGATMANFAALAAARHSVLKRMGWDVEAEGLVGAPAITVVVGDEVHPTVIKVIGLLGLGRERVVRVPVDDQGCLRPDAMPELRAPAIVCAQAGNVNSGGFDPLAEIGAVARDAGAWVHVDGAFGLWAAASPKHAHLVAGLAEADSWATDAHKWLNVPYDCGIVMVRQGRTLAAAMSLEAAYLPVEATREPFHYTPESSRRARGVEVWAALKGLGRRGLAELIERNCRQAARFAERLRAAGHRVLNRVVLNQVVVSFGDAGTTRRVIAALQEEGTCWCGPTDWQGHTAMRISVSSWATTDEDVERSIDAMLRVAEQG